MTAFVIFIHAVVCVLLAIIVLMQAGRGGGLTEGFGSSAESIFGAQTNTFLVKGTTVLATLFIITSLSLAYLSAQKNKSLMTGVEPKTAAPAVPAAGEEVPLGETPVEEPVVLEEAPITESQPTSTTPQAAAPAQPSTNETPAAESQNAPAPQPVQ